MPRVVPTQVVPFIERKFPWIRPENSARVEVINRGSVRALVHLLDKVPEELLILSGEDYAELVMSVGVLDMCWQDRGPGREYHTTEVAAVRTLHRLMQLCPDD